jgi:hypothetical protein
MDGQRADGEEFMVFPKRIKSSRVCIHETPGLPPRGQRVRQEPHRESSPSGKPASGVRCQAYINPFRSGSLLFVIFGDTNSRESNERTKSQGSFVCEDAPERGCSRVTVSV